MGALMATILAVIPNVFIGVIAKLVTESFLQTVLEKVLMAGLERAAAMTTNTLDDELVRDIEKRLKGDNA